MEFLAPSLLLGLLALPILWLLLRAVPPRPLIVKFPAVVLLLGLKDAENTPDRTPWWLLLLRLIAIACLIIGFASPVLRSAGQSGDGPLVIALDASWASAQTWETRVDKVNAVLEDAAVVGRPVAVLTLSDTPTATDFDFATAQDWQQRVTGLTPAAWGGQYQAWAVAVAESVAAFDVIWLSDGLNTAGRSDLYEAFAAKGDVQVFEEAKVMALGSPAITQDGLTVPVQTLGTEPETTQISLVGPDPSGILRTLMTAEVGADAEASFDVPLELRNRVQRVVIDGVRSAGAVQLVGTRLQKRKVALIATRGDEEAALLTSPFHFLRQALADSAVVIEGGHGDMLAASPNVIILADGAAAPELEDWVRQGGVLVRFAGPQLINLDIDILDRDPMLPVRLRGGGRSVGGALSWGTPKTLAPFDDGSPFAGLEVPEDVTVSRQVMAQPDPDLAEKVLARLQDGTPLVTAKSVGAGRVVLVHVTANADWSNLPISGLFVQMLERLSIASANLDGVAEDFGDQSWVAETVLDEFGELQQASLPAVSGTDLAAKNLGPGMPPGVYSANTRQVAINVITNEILERASWPIPVQPFAQPDPLPLKAILLALGIGLLMLDILASLWMTGRLRRSAQAVVATAALLMVGTGGEAQDTTALQAANNTVLAYVITGNAQVDAASKAGLTGLSRMLNARTSIEPVEPMGVIPGQDELAFYALLYWPVTEGQTLPEAARAPVNQFLRTGGLILFDTLDAHLGGLGMTPNGRALRRITEGLDIPPLEPVPQDHVLTRAFYLLSDFPGRHQNAPVWIEAAPPDAEAQDGVPFRNLNDGVTPVIIGGNDWSAAWAVNPQGQFIYPVGRGFAGSKQREMAFRFGINLVMYVMTGNYKSDQVHVPALLDRLGQ